MEVFEVTATFAETDNFALAEFASRVSVCQGENFQDLSNTLQADCVHHLISSSAVCSLHTKADGIGNDFVCVINRIPINAADIKFECVGVCPLANADMSEVFKAAEPAGTCAMVEVPGFTGSCYPSGYCQVAEQGIAFKGSFGEFCPSTTGEYCCGADTARNTTVFGGQDPTLAGGTLDYLNTMDHIADLSFNIHYEVDAPALLKITVDVPYVRSTTTVNYKENGVEKAYFMCPSTYMIDFEDPISTLPEADSSRRTDEKWLPLWHFPSADRVGRPRSSCGNYDMQYDGDTEFKEHFVFPDTSTSDKRLTYGGVPAVDPDVWDSSISTQGIPYGADTLWKMSAPNHETGRVNYTSGSSDGGFFDLLKTYSKCKDYNTGESLVRRNVEASPTVINGMSYPVESYEWTMSVCQTGFFGLNCADPEKVQMYAKTCARVPASFSVTPQQLSHVVTSPVTENLVSKTFLQRVDSTRSNCNTGEERIAVTLTLFVMAKEYTIFTQDVHDVLKPTGIFDGSQKDINITNRNTHKTVDSFLNSLPESEGVYKLKDVDVTAGGVSMYSEQLVIVTKCYNTGLDSRTGIRRNPSVFADAAEDGFGRVNFDVEVTVKKMDAAVKNTLNLRVLATKDTFMLRSTDELSMESISADHAVYGSYEVARSDTGEGLDAALTFDDGLALQMSGGDQICSKQQAKGFDAQMTTMMPNAVGACMLTQAGVDAAAADGSLLHGSSIRYRTAGMTEPATYVYGCFNDWIDIDGAELSDGVYEFNGQLQRMTGTHDSIFWFVQKAALNEVVLGNTNQKLSDRFGTGLFYYNSTNGMQVVQKSGQMQLDSTTRELAESSLTSGCVTTSGNLKAACNLVCFDLVTGLLSDPTGETSRNVLVHHISVATIATEGQSTNDKKFNENKKHRRVLLETATAVTPSSGVKTGKNNAKSITVKATKNSGSGTGSGGSGGSGTGSNTGSGTGSAYTGPIIERNVKGPKNMQAVAYPVIIIGVPIVALSIAWLISVTVMQIYKKADTTNPNAKMYSVSKQYGEKYGDLVTPLVHRPQRTRD